MRRGSSAERGYGARWGKYRAAWLRLHPLCGDRCSTASPEHSLCLQQGRIAPAREVDHIHPAKPDDPQFWDAANLQSLCHRCHSTKTATHDRGFGNK